MDTHLTYLARRPLRGAQALKLCEDLSSLPLRRIAVLRLSLRETGAIDATGVAVITRIHSHLMQLGSRLELVDLDTDAEQMLRRVGIANMVPISRSVPAAAAAHDTTLATA